MLVDVLPRLTTAYESMFDNYAPKFWFEDSRAVRRQDENEYVVEVTLPGLEKDDIKVSTKGNLLQISAKNKEDSNRNISYNNQFTLPRNLDLDNMSAKYEQGILTIKLPKMEKSEPQSKEVEVA